MFTLCNNSLLSLSALCMCTDGIQLVLFFWNEYEYHLELDIFITLIYLSVQMTLYSFANLLYVMCEFNIGVAHMLITWHQHCA